jgi:hypothetical protein
MSKKTRQVFIGTFYGYNLNIEVPAEQKELPNKWFIQQFQDWKISERKNAVDEYLFEQRQKTSIWSKLIFKKDL